MVSTPSSGIGSARDQAFQPYAIEIGFLVREWNELQATLRSLFGTLLDASATIYTQDTPEQFEPFDFWSAGDAIWYAIPNDRFQRKMLEEIAAHRLPAQSKLLAEIRWLIAKANSTGSQRDDAIHSPVIVSYRDLSSGSPIDFIADYLFGNPRAMKLREKDLLQEFPYYQERAKRLADYAHALNQHLRKFTPPEWRDDTKLAPLPQRPTLPPAPQKMTGGE